ncbi:MAG TPA: tetratricopeptide repeat protein, partial [bacterium]|nr:tetratricopeptide repeat protein [bacterium]
MDKVNRAVSTRPFVTPISFFYCLTTFSVIGLAFAGGAHAALVTHSEIASTAIIGATGSSGDVEAVYEKALALEKEGEIQKAIEAYNEVLRLSPAHERAQRRLKRLRRLGYEVTPAAPSVTKSRAKETLNETTQSALDRALEKARIYLDARQPAEAEKVLREAQTQFPDQPELSKMLDEAAALRSQLTQEEQARQAAADAARIQALSSSASEKFQEGMTYYRAGDVIKAVETWKDAQKVYPDHGPTREALATSKEEYEKALKAKQEKEALDAQEKAWEEKLELKYGYETKGDSDISDVLNTLSNLCGLKMVIGEGVAGKVNFRVDKDTTIRQILNLIQENYGFMWERKGDTIIVKRGFKTRIFPLSEAQYKTLKAILEDPKTLEDPSKDLRTILYGADGSMKMPGKELFLNDRTRSLVVTDSENNLEKVQEFLDHMPSIAQEDRPLVTRIYQLHPETAKKLYRIIELRLYQDVGQYGGLTGEGRRLYLSPDNTLIVVDYPENISVVEQILQDKQIQGQLEEGELTAQHFAVTDMFDIGQREEDLDRRVQTTRAVVEVLETMLYGTGKQEAILKGRRMFPNEERGTIDVVDTPENLKRVSDYLASIRGEAQQDVLIETYRIQHIPVTDVADVLGFLFFNQTQTTRTRFLDVQGLDTLGTDESGQEIDLSSGFEESSRELYNIQQGGGGQDLTTLFSISYFPDMNTNTLVVLTPDKEALDFITNIINAFDRPPRMLEMEQRTVSVSLKDLRSVGLDYLITNPFRSHISVEPEDSDQTLGMINDPDAKESMRFTVDTFGESRLNFVLSLMESLSSAEVLVAPKVLHVPTANMNEPMIFVGTQEPYISSADIDDQGDDDPTNNRLIIEFDRAIVGVLMRFYPVILNDDHVLIELMPNKTEIYSRAPVVVE